MDELQETLNSLLNNPAEMERLTKAASAILGGDAAPALPESSAQEDLPMLQTMLSRIQNGGSSDSQKLLEAMKPFLAEKRRAKLDRAIRIAKLASIAELAMGENGGGQDV